MGRSNEKHELWKGLILEAFRSGKKIRQWCQEHDIKTRRFYWWSKRLGITRENAGFSNPDVVVSDETDYGISELDSSVRNQEDISSSMDVPDPVTAHQNAVVEIRLKNDMAVPDHDPVPNPFPLITVQAGPYQIGICDGFNPKTLAGVLEVLHYA